MSKRMLRFLDGCCTAIVGLLIWGDMFNWRVWAFILLTAISHALLSQEAKRD